MGGGFLHASTAMPVQQNTIIFQFDEVGGGYQFSNELENGFDMVAFDLK